MSTKKIKVTVQFFNKNCNIISKARVLKPWQITVSKKMGLLGLMNVILPPGGCVWDCHLPLAPVAPGRGRLTYLCALTVSPTQGHDDLLLVASDKLGHVTIITVLSNTFFLVKIIFCI